MSLKIRSCCWSYSG